MINRAILTQQVSVGAQTATLAHDAEHKPLQACHRPPSCTGMTTEKQPARECPVLHASARTPPRAARERPVSYIRCSGPGARTSCECDACNRNRREACSAKRPWRMMQNTSRCRRVIGRRAARERPPKSNWHANAQCCSHASARRQVSALDQPRRHSKTVGEVFGPPIGASEAASGSSTLPEVRWSDVSGPPASRSYTQGVDEQPSIEVKQLQPGSLLKGPRTS